MAKKPKDKTQDIRKLTDEELAKELEEAHKRLFSVRLQTETRQIANHRQLPAARKQVARLKTIMRERQFAAAREDS